MSRTPHRLLLVAGLLAILVTALLGIAAWRLHHARGLVAQVRANCRCCGEIEP